jgi:hypothetical protein
LAKYRSEFICSLLCLIWRNQSRLVRSLCCL